MMAMTRRSMVLASLAVLVGCRHELATDLPVPAPARRVRDALLAGADLEGLLDPATAARLRADVDALVDEHGPLAAGPAVVIESSGVVSANLNLTADGQPVGRIRVIVGPDGTVRRVDVLPPYLG